jgi:hypothetical protein
MSLCIEKKLTLSGRTFLFDCELLLLNSDLGVLKYVIDREYVVQGIKLQPGDITYALYWTNRPYTLYVWHLAEDRVVHYFNIADRISLLPREFLWRDLTVDILIADDRSVHILDEDELPDDLDPALSSYIQKAKAAVIQEYSSIIHEANSIVSSLSSHAALPVQGKVNKPHSAG